MSVQTQTPSLVLSSPPSPSAQPTSRRPSAYTRCDPTYTRSSQLCLTLSLSAQGFEYSRSGNPNRDAFEATLASLEAGGAHGIAFASGSATTATVLQSLGPNSHIVSVNDVYGGTFRYMTRVAGINQGLETTFLDLENADDEAILAAIRPNTKVRINTLIMSQFRSC